MFGSDIQNPILVLIEAFNNSDENFVSTFKSLVDFLCVIFKCEQINWMFLIDTGVY